jgi:hypothetical protein
MSILNPITLEAVEQEFSKWRATKKNGEKIPQLLWDQLKTLYSQGVPIFKRFGITTLQARRHGIVASSRKTPRVKKTAKAVMPLIEISMPGAFIPQTPNHIPVVTLKRGEFLLSLEYPTEAHIQLLLNTLGR